MAHASVSASSGISLGKDWTPLPGVADSASTDAEGRYRLRLPASRFAVKVQAGLPLLDEGPETCLPYASYGEPLENLRRTRADPGTLTREELESLTFPAPAPGEEIRRDIVLGRGEGFLLTLTRSDDGQPVEGPGNVCVLCPAAQGSGGRDLSVSREISGGRLQLQGIDPGKYSIRDTVLKVTRGCAHADLRLGDFPVAEKAAGEILSLPIYPEMTDEQALTVARAVRDVA